MNEKITCNKNFKDANLIETTANTEEKTPANAAKNSNKIPRFGKEKILQSEKFSSRRDVLNVILENGHDYSISDVNRILNDFLKGKVN